MTTMDIISGIAKCVVPCLPYIASITGIDYIFSYKKNLEKLKTEVRTLEQAKKDVEDRVQADQTSRLKIHVDVWPWLTEAGKNVADTNRFIDIEEDRCCLGKCPNMWTRKEMSKKFEKMTEKTADIIKRKVVQISYADTSQGRTTPCRVYEALNSRASQLNEIKKALLDPKLYMIGIHGMAGVGKSTFVNELARQVKKDGGFGVVVIATITHSPNVEEIQDQIAESLSGPKLAKTTKVGREKELCERIQNEKSVVIILDDIWKSELDLKKMGIPYGDEHNSCKLVLTSRDCNVLMRMGTKKNFELLTLEGVESWILFKKIVGEEVFEESNIEETAKEVVNYCADLPLLIAAVASGLTGNKNVSAWNVALNQLKELNCKELKENTYPAIMFSYFSLDSMKLKSIFLIVGSFGLDEIDTEDLFLCCCGLGFYQDKHTLADARDQHYTLIDDLRASSLLLQGKPDMVRMHDVVRGAAKLIASRSPSNYSIYPNYEDELRNLHHIDFRSSMSRPRDDVFSDMKELRTLSLRRMLFTPSPPDSLFLLTSLRSLNLYECDLGDISKVGNLTKLELLSLESCSNLKELPKEIGCLTELRFLNLTNCSQLRVIPTNLISSLKCLEELYLGDCYIQWEAEGRKNESNNACLNELQNLHKLTALEILIQDTSVLPSNLQFLAKLKRYNIWIGNDMRECDRSSKWCGGDCGISKTLKLTDSWWTSITLTAVEDLNFDKLKGVQYLLYNLDVKGFPQLKHLRIQDSHELLHIINSTRKSVSAFPNLETLVLDTLHKMEEICHGRITNKCFAKLEVIKVKSCPELKSLLMYSLAKNLSQLHKMEIYSCRGMREIIAMDKLEDEKERPKIILPELHFLTLENLPKLQSFSLPLPVDNGNPSLQSIPLTLFNHQVGRALVKLQHLLISKCSMLKEIFVHEEEDQFPNLETLDISHMFGLRKIWHNQVSQNSFLNLMKINIIGCKSLDFVFPISVAKVLRKLQVLEIGQCDMKNIVEKSDNTGDMTHVYLEKLSIRDCDNIETIVPSSVLFPSLVELHVVDCRGVVKIMTPLTTSSLPKLRILSIKNCEKLEEIYGSKNESDAPLNESAFMKLEELTLRCLPRLTGFHHNLKFQSLETVRLKECPLMDTFRPEKLANLAAPSFLKVQSEWEEDESKSHLYGGLNNTIKTIFTKKNKI